MQMRGTHSPLGAFATSSPWNAALFATGSMAIELLALLLLVLPRRLRAIVLAPLCLLWAGFHVGIHLVWPQVNYLPSAVLYVTLLAHRPEVKDEAVDGAYDGAVDGAHIEDTLRSDDELVTTGQGVGHDALLPRATGVQPPAMPPARGLSHQQASAIRALLIGAYALMALTRSEVWPLTDIPMYSQLRDASWRFRREQLCLTEQQWRQFAHEVHTVNAEASRYVGVTAVFALPHQLCTEQLHAFPHQLCPRSSFMQQLPPLVAAKIGNETFADAYRLAPTAAFGAQARWPSSTRSLYSDAAHALMLHRLDPAARGAVRRRNDAVAWLASVARLLAVHGRPTGVFKDLEFVGLQLEVVPVCGEPRARVLGSVLANGTEPDCRRILHDGRAREGRNDGMDEQGTNKGGWFVGFCERERLGVAWDNESHIAKILFLRRKRRERRSHHM